MFISCSLLSALHQFLSSLCTMVPGKAKAKAAETGGGVAPKSAPVKRVTGKVTVSQLGGGTDSPKSLKALMAAQKPKAVEPKGGPEALMAAPKPKALEPTGGPEPLMAAPKPKAVEPKGGLLNFFARRGPPTQQAGTSKSAAHSHAPGDAGPFGGHVAHHCVFERGGHCCASIGAE